MTGTGGSFLYNIRYAHIGFLCWRGVVLSLVVRDGLKSKKLCGMQCYVAFCCLKSKKLCGICVD